MYIMLDNYVKEYINGNQDAFDEIYIQTQKLVFSICLSYMKDRSLAEDMMQDAYLNAIRYISNYKLGTSIEAWLVTIAKNTCLNEIKRRKKVTYVGDYFDNAIIDESESNCNETEKEDTPLLDIALKILNDKELIVLLPHIIDGKQLVDIAYDTNLPEGTVRWRYNNALNKIRKHIERSKKNDQ